MRFTDFLTNFSIFEVWLAMLLLSTQFTDSGSLVFNGFIAVVSSFFLSWFLDLNNSN